MIIFQINKFFYPSGGADRHYLNLIELLINNKYEVVPFGMRLNRHQKSIIQNPNLRNLYDKYKKYFVSYVNFGKNKSLKDFVKLGRLFWSFEAKKNFEELISNFKSYNQNLKFIAHLHNIYHQISPSILPTIKRHKIATVMTVHDLHLIAPIYSENIFEKAICSVELFLHNKILNINKYIDLFIAPSEFIKKELIKFKIDENKIKVLPHFINQEPTIKYETTNKQSKNYLLYFGRLANEKGVDILIKAYLKSGVDLPLYIAGSGPNENFLKSKYKTSKINYLGNLEKDKLNEVIAGSLFTVVPSRAPEAFGMSTFESYQFKKPVIAANIGALPEFVKNNETGLLFKAQDIEDLSQKIKILAQNPKMCFNFGQNGFNFAQKFSQANYLKSLTSIYDTLVHTDRRLTSIN